MSDPYGRTMLSSWIKMPQTSTDSTSISLERQSTSAKSNSIDQWSAIFGRTGKGTGDSNEPTEKHELQEKEVELPRKSLLEKSDVLESDSFSEKLEKTKFQKRDDQRAQPKKRKINPRNPFNSFVVSLKVPKNWKPCSKQQTDDTESKSSKALPSIGGASVGNTQAKADVPNFFTKRNSKPIKSCAKLTPQKLQHPSWNIQHIRPESSWAHLSILRRNQNKRTYRELNFGLPLPSSIVIPEEIKTPKRRVMSSSQLSALSERMNSQDSSSLLFLNRHAENKNAFDRGLFEQQMWAEKYAPKTRNEHLKPAQVEQIEAWLSARLDKCNKSKPARQKSLPTSGKTQLGGFIVSDNWEEEEMQEEGDILVVNGATGSGKTSAVYAACATLGMLVFEVSSAVKRTGKDLGSMLDGIGQNHSVHSTKSVVILIDDADIVYENEAGSFWPTLTKFAATSRRPVVLTCTDMSLINMPISRFETITLGTPDMTQVTKLVRTIALCEGHLIDLQRSAQLVVQLGGDIRRILADLQFWCQYGVGGSSSGCEWVPKQWELEHADRIISDGTSFPLPNENCSSLDEEKDEIMTRSDDDLWTNGALSLQQWSDPIHLVKQLGNCNYLRQTFYLETWNFGTPLVNLALDVAPFTRFIVSQDLERNSKMSAALANQSLREARMTRRIWRASGNDSRQYFGMNVEEMVKVVKTGFPDFVNIASQTEEPNMDIE